MRGGVTAGVFIVPRTPGLIWVLGLLAGDVMVDWSIREGRLRPLGLWWTAAGRRESQSLRELAGRLVSSWTGGLGGKVGGGVQLTGSSALGPSSRRVWKERRASLRAIVKEARVWLSPRALSAR